MLTFSLFKDPIFAKFDQGVSNKIHDISDSDSDDNDVKATIVAPPRVSDVESL